MVMSPIVKQQMLCTYYNLGKITFNKEEDKRRYEQ